MSNLHRTLRLARLARLRNERLAREAEALARTAARLERNKAVREYREAKVDGTLPPAKPQKSIDDVGGYDLNGNPL